MPRSFLALLWEGFLKVQGVAGLVVSLAVAVMLWIFAPQTTIPLLVALPVLIAFVLFVAALLTALYESYKKGGTLPRVLITRTSTQTGDLIFLLEPSPLFSHGTLVSFYYLDEGNFEHFIGFGSVLNVQEDGKVQAIMARTLKGQEAILERLSTGEAAVLSRTRVKPSVPSLYAESLREE